MLLFESFITDLHQNISVESKLGDLAEDIRLASTPGFKTNYKTLYRRSIKPLQQAYNCRILTISNDGQNFRFLYRFNVENN